MLATYEFMDLRDFVEKYQGSTTLVNLGKERFAVKVLVPEAYANVPNSMFVSRRVVNSLIDNDIVCFSNNEEDVRFWMHMSNDGRTHPEVRLDRIRLEWWTESGGTDIGKKKGMD